jgi:hypothetical protein
MSDVITKGLISGDTAIPRVLIDITEAARINALAGNVFAGGWGAIRSQLKIIQSELNEGHESAEMHDIATLQDDIQDLFFTVAGLAYRSGLLVNSAEDWAAVCASQYSKFDTSYEEWLNTKDKYDRLGMEVHYVQRTDAESGIEYWITLSSKDQLDEKQRNCSKGKWLKSYKFKEPVLTPIPEMVKEVFGEPLATETTAA